jgi:hypothetical protein
MCVCACVRVCVCVRVYGTCQLWKVGIHVLCVGIGRDRNHVSSSRGTVTKYASIDQLCHWEQIIHLALRLVFHILYCIVWMHVMLCILHSVLHILYILHVVTCRNMARESTMAICSLPNQYIQS